MSDSSGARSAVADRLLHQIQAQRGHVRPWHELMADVDPDFLAAHEQMLAAARGSDSPLPKKVSELVLFAAALSMDVHPDTIAAHADFAVGAGATDAEMLAAVELVIIVKYSKTLRVGVSAVMETSRREDSR